jgi:hypothetical protein
LAGSLGGLKCITRKLAGMTTVVILPMYSPPSLMQSISWKGCIRAGDWRCMYHFQPGCLHVGQPASTCRACAQARELENVSAGTRINPVPTNRLQRFPDVQNRQLWYTKLPKTELGTGSDSRRVGVAGI